MSKKLSTGDFRSVATRREPRRGVRPTPTTLPTRQSGAQPPRRGLEADPDGVVEPAALASARPRFPVVVCRTLPRRGSAARGCVSNRPPGLRCGNRLEARRCRASEAK